MGAPEMPICVPIGAILEGMLDNPGLGLALLAEMAGYDLAEGDLVLDLAIEAAPGPRHAGVAPFLRRLADALDAALADHPDPQEETDL